MLSRLMPLILLAALLALAAPARAQDPPPTPGSLARGHRLIAGDQVEIHILALPEHERIYTVRSDGGFYHPIIGEVEASGKTIPELQKLIEKRLARELRNPECRVGLHTMARQDVTILGEVTKPGKYEVIPGTTLLDVLAMAGGNTALADLSTAVLLRDGKQQTVDLTPPDPSATESLQVMVEPGDILYLLPGTSVSVTGDVINPGVYSLPRRDCTPLRALRAAGGAQSGAALNRVVLQRATMSRPMILDLSTDSPELPAEASSLVAGDMLVVPPRQVMILGGVSKAGPVPVHGGENVLEVIMQAGVKDPGVLDDVTIIRGSDILAGRKKTEKVDLTPYVEKGDTSVLVPIHDGDVVYVPAQDQGGGILDFLTPLLWVRGLFGVP